MIVYIYVYTIVYIWWCPENALRPVGPPSDRVPGANFERLKNEVSVGY